MARPLKESEPLATSIAVRVPASVKADWQARAAAAGLGFGDWMREVIDADSVVATGRPSPRRRELRRPAAGTDPELVAELARIGNNLNQLARWANMYKSAADRVQVLAALSAIERDVRLALGNSDAP